MLQQCHFLEFSIERQGCHFSGIFPIFGNFDFDSGIKCDKKKVGKIVGILSFFGKFVGILSFFLFYGKMKKNKKKFEENGGIRQSAQQDQLQTTKSYKITI